MVFCSKVSTHLFKALLYHCHIWVELVVDSRLCHSFLKVVVKEQGVQDHLPKCKRSNCIYVCGRKKTHVDVSVRLTKAVAVVIFVPPDAPTTIFTLLSLSKMIVGHMEDSGLFPTTDKQKAATTA